VRLVGVEVGFEDEFVADVDGGSYARPQRLVFPTRSLVGVVLSITERPEGGLWRDG
jgi:hypothetical protein